MDGYLLTLFTHQDRRHAHRPLHEWLLDAARGLGLRGGTVVPGAESFGHDGRRHSAHFFELADQPVEVQLALTTDQLQDFFALLARERVEVFYVTTRVEFGTTGPSG